MSSQCANIENLPCDFKAFLLEIKAELFKHTKDQSEFYNFDFEQQKPYSKTDRFYWEKEN